MIYTSMTKKAMKTAYEAHKDQLDKSGLPYIYHPIHLAEQMENELAVCAALLHDVVEDTSVTVEDLKSEGFSEKVIEAVQLLTHDDAVDYMDYVKKIKDSGNAVAKEIKVADLKHNSDITRLESINEKMADNLEKYKRALELLLS
ncbi:MAG: HD domain-containing protein [Clostridiales bacterium]|jgi:(p)ppGpp synthase/HD superfamily hydrolase|nr:HD domain-containing protein [Clostridiales bacterium]